MKSQNVIKNNVFLSCFSAFFGHKSLEKHLELEKKKGFRLVYKLSYLFEKKFWFFLPNRGTLIKKKWKFFSQPDMTICTTIESPHRV